MSDVIEQSQPTNHLLAQMRNRLSEFFHNKQIKNLTSVLVPGALAAMLFPIFGPAVAGTAAAAAIKNGLSLLKIDLSEETIEKLLKPLEGQNLDENDVQEGLQETLNQLLPTDPQVNEEAAKALVVAAPMIKETALTNKQLDATWLGKSMENSLSTQGGRMAGIAFDVHRLLLEDGDLLNQEVQNLLTHISTEIIVDHGGEISDIEVNSEAGDGIGSIKQKFAADNQGKISNVKINTKSSKL